MLTKKKIITFSIIGAGVLLALVLLFGPVGRYAFADKYCEINPKASVEALAGVPNSYKDTEKFKIYCEALLDYKEGRVEEAVKVFEELDYYRNCRKYIRRMYYDNAVLLREKGNFDSAVDMFEKSAYEDYKEQIKETEYLHAKSLQAEEKWAEAVIKYEAAKNYKDSVKNKLDCKTKLMNLSFENEAYEEAEKYAEEIASEDIEKVHSVFIGEFYYNYGESLIVESLWEEAAERFKKSAELGYEGAEEKRVLCENTAVYNKAVALMDEEKYEEAIALFDTIKGFLDADELNLACENKTYKWDFTGYLSKDGTEKTKTKTFVRTDTIYFYGTLTGGKPDKSIDLLFIWTDVAGCTVTTKVENWQNGSSGGVTFSYSNPKNANFGKSNIVVINEETGIQLAKYNFTINK